MSDEAERVERGGLGSLFLVVAVAAILVAGMVLRTSGSAKATGIAKATPPPELSLPLGATVTPEAAPAVVATAPEPASEPESVPAFQDPPPPAPESVQPDPVLMKLASRAASDASRLEKSRGRWTAQLLVACKPETVSRMLDNGRGSTKLYVLPAQIREEACFRVCFGTYASGKEASAAADLPKTLRGKDRIAAVEVAKVLP